MVPVAPPPIISLRRVSRLPEPASRAAAASIRRCKFEFCRRASSSRLLPCEPSLLALTGVPPLRLASSRRPRPARRHVHAHPTFCNGGERLGVPGRTFFCCGRALGRDWNDRNGSLEPRLRRTCRAHLRRRVSRNAHPAPPRDPCGADGMTAGHLDLTPPGMMVAAAGPLPRV